MWALLLSCEYRVGFLNLLSPMNSVDVLSARLGNCVHSEQNMASCSFLYSIHGNAVFHGRTNFRFHLASYANGWVVEVLEAVIKDCSVVAATVLAFSSSDDPLAKNVVILLIAYESGNENKMVSVMVSLKTHGIACLSSMLISRSLRSACGVPD